MKVEQDFEQFVRLLNDHKVRYLIVGAYAVGFHAEPRNTGDIDIWIDSTDHNIEKIIVVLDKFGFSSLEITKEDLLKPETVTQLGYPPLRIDLLTSLSGLTFDHAYKSLVKGQFGSIMMNFISLPDLITNKEATGRMRDKADAETLRNFQKKGDHI